MTQLRSAQLPLKKPVLWLMKTEPDVFSFENLVEDKTTFWEGVRNYTARNFMMKDMKVGDTVFFYHSNALPPGIVGLAEVITAALPDKTATDKKSEYFDPRATKENPVWFGVTIGKPIRAKNFLSLNDLKKMKQVFIEELENSEWNDFKLLNKGNRLSIVPVPELVSINILDALFK
jgi:predicted RNA-binding protein with PUA-like domain